jgi:FKBP-type peptidyl-prolyl cis-trans isomerase FklB
MKLFITVTICALLIAGHVFAADQAEPKSQKDKASYSIGFDIGSNMKRQAIDLNADLMCQGMKDGFSGAKPLLDEKEMSQTLRTFQTEMRAKLQQRNKEAAEKNKKEGEAFLAENKKKPGIITTPSGLQYKVLKEGSGASPKATETVVVHYRGTLIDETEFDSSYRRQTPATFEVGSVIKGWTEALQMMKPGAKWLLYIPANLAYGDRGAGSTIGPNAVLIFEIDLLSVKGSEPPPPKK